MGTGGLWPGLFRFVADPKIPLDTNSVERALRGVAVGRKNNYGKPVGARHADRGASLLAHRVGEAVQGRAARLSTGGHLAGRQGPRRGDSRSRCQVTGILREIDA